LSGLKPKFYCNLCQGQSISSVWKHVLTVKHRQLKAALKREKDLAVAKKRPERQDAGCETTHGQWDSSQFDNGQANGGIQADVDENFAICDMLWEEDLSDLAKVLEIFKDSKVSGSKMSSNGWAAEMLWSEMDEKVSNTDSSKGEREKKKVMKKAGNKWYPFASKEVSQAGRGSLNSGGGFTADTSTT
jgi:hypothetical protein